MLRRIGVLLVVVLAVASVAEVASAHRVRFGGSLTVNFQSATNVFKGRVSSSRDACERGRTVSVYRVVEGPDQRVAWDRTDSAGRWSVVHVAQAGTYYAKTGAKDIGPGAHRHICRALSTSTFDIPPRCGNGFVEAEAGEQCDDGNTINNDGCNNSCQTPVCGNSIVELGEECDDGNTTNGDGCSSACTVEGLAAHVAAKEPGEGPKSACARLRESLSVKSALRPASASRLVS